jgi:hypothetical protein
MLFRVKQGYAHLLRLERRPSTKVKTWSPLRAMREFKEVVTRCTTCRGILPKWGLLSNVHF